MRTDTIIPLATQWEDTMQTTAICTNQTGFRRPPVGAGGPVSAAHSAMVVSLAGCCPRPMPVFARMWDVEDRLEHLRGVLDALSGYLGAVLDDVGQNVPGGLDLRFIEALLCDLKSEVSGTLRQAAESLPAPRRRP